VLSMMIPRSSILLSFAGTFDRIFFNSFTAFWTSLETGLRETFFLAMYSSRPTNISEGGLNARASSSQIENLLGGRSVTNEPSAVKN